MISLPAQSPTVMTMTTQGVTQATISSQSRQPRAPMISEYGSQSHLGGRGSTRQPYTVHSRSTAGFDINRASRSGAIDFDCFMERHYGRS